MQGANPCQPIMAVTRPLHGVSGNYNMTKEEYYIHQSIKSLEVKNDKEMDEMCVISYGSLMNILLAIQDLQQRLRILDDPSR